MGIVTTIAPVALALIMLGLGASLTVKDFTRVFQNPKEFFVGLTCQLFLLPIIAYLLIILTTHVVIAYYDKLSWANDFLFSCPPLLNEILIENND